MSPRIALPQAALANAIRLRRSPWIVSYWDESGLVCHNYLNHERFTAAPIITTVLDFFNDWKPLSELILHLPQFSPASLGRTIRQLVASSLLEVEGFVDPKSAAMEAWKQWSPAAPFFHFATKDVKYRTELELSDYALRKYVRDNPQPCFFKRCSHEKRIDVPRVKPSGDSEFLKVLFSRRSWREFAPKKLRRDHLAQLLNLTWGVQKYMRIKFLGLLPLKTSPSAGARHPTEVYVLALRVQGLARGIYHYCSDTHQLERVAKAPSKQKLIRYLGGQWWYGEAAAVFVMTAVFPRNMWKYAYARSYRAVLLDAGHLCQTLCLTATWLGLAPFCTAAVADSLIERDLGIDGITESVVYVAGVGIRP